MAVNSYTEWQPLKEVIIGSPLNWNMQEDDLTFRAFFHDNIFGWTWRKEAKDLDRTQIKYKQYCDEMEEDLLEIKNKFEEMSIRVRRPQSLDSPRDFNTPFWKSSCVPALNVRDLTLIVGNEIIETPTQVRSRLFENDLLKPLFNEYFNDGAKWTSAPRPMILDQSLDISYVLSRGAKDIDYPLEKSPFNVGHEIMFDAAQCLRFGKDIVMNISTKNHMLGTQWLQKHLGDSYRVHTVSLVDNHIDTTFLPLRPGVLLMHPMMIGREHELPKFLQKWDKIIAPEAPESSFPIYSKETLMLASKHIDVNVLSIDEEHVMVNDSYTTLISRLEKNGFTPVPVRLRHRRVFGGGLHCLTLDVEREGNLEDYTI